MAINLKSENIKLFNNCTDAEMKAISKKATVLTVKRGDPVFVVNDPSHYVYLVVSGAVDIVTQANVRNQYVKLRTVTANEHFGELSVLVGERHHTSAFARENTELLCLHKDDYQELVRNTPAVNHNQLTILLKYYLQTLKDHISLPVLKDKAQAKYDRGLLKLKQWKVTSTSKAIPLKLESNVMTVGFALPLSKDLIDQIQAQHPTHKLKMMLLEDKMFEDLRAQYINFYSGSGHIAMGAAPQVQMRSPQNVQNSLEDLKFSTILLSQLPADVFQSLVPHFESTDYAEGDVIYSPEQPSSRFYFVASGQVELSKDVQGLGVSVAYANADQYDVFFDTTLLGEGHMKASAIAQSPCRIFSLSKEVFEDLLQSADFLTHFTITLAQMVNNLNKGASQFEYYSKQGMQVALMSRPLLPAAKVKAFKILPLDLMDGELTLGILQPNREVLDEAIDSYLRGLNVRTCLITQENFNAWVAKMAASSETEHTVTVLRNSPNDNRTLKPVVSEPTLAVEEILQYAIQSRASDIHFEPSEKSLVVRYRIDGVMMQLWDNFPIALGLNILRRIKVMSEMDITEERLPQDGQFKFRKNELESSFRVSSVPTRFGEKLVLRTTGRKNAVIPLQLLAPNTEITRFFNRLVKYQQGIFFITGPTGSGKSTTMYSILSQLNTRDRNVITIEDPIEANLSGINQIEIDEKVGLTHVSILRNVLRQDPDVIMIGEIRDEVSMQLALDAALAGQLVLTTIHASNTFEVIPRIKELGGTASHIASGLIGVMAQRLVRQLCECKKPRAVTAAELKVLEALNSAEPITTVMQECGCSKCNFTGFSGQIPVFEFWEKTMNIHNVLVDDGSSEELIAAIRESNVVSLTTYGLKLVAQGQTTLGEVNDVLFGITDLMAS